MQNNGDSDARDDRGSAGGGGAREADRQRSDLEQALGDRINAVLSAARALSERSASQFHPDLQPAAFHIARWLYAYGAARPSDIAEAVGMDRSSTSTLVGRMRALGLAASTPDEEDRRSIRVDLTPLGRERVALALAERGEVFTARTRDWSSADLERLIELLGRLTA